jgi:hypothetical protein
MSPELARRTKWEIDTRLEALLGENVRVRAKAFAPIPGGSGPPPPLIEASSLILPDGTRLNRPLYIEGKLQNFDRRVSVVFVILESIDAFGDRANGPILFRGHQAEIFQAPAAVKLSIPHFVERIPQHPITYWHHIQLSDLQLPLPFPDLMQRHLSRPQPSALEPSSFPISPECRVHSSLTLREESCDPLHERRNDMNERPSTKPKFDTGRIVATPNALETVHPEDTFLALARHMVGDWGDCGPEDWKENELSLKEGFRLFSVYHDRKGIKFWIITEADRSVTTILLPEDY